MGIEPTFEAWEASVLPLNDTRIAVDNFLACSHRGAIIASLVNNTTNLFPLFHNPLIK